MNKTAQPKAGKPEAAKPKAGKPENGEPETGQSEKPLQVLVVDDEPLARSRMRSLLGDCRNPRAELAAEAANTPDAMDLLVRQRFDAALIDIHMPGANGMQLARQLNALPAPPPFIFVTAYAEHALDAFELDAVDYLTKPVRCDRLEAALQKVVRARLARAAQGDALDGQWVLISERGRAQRIPLAEVLYFKAEQKYVTVRTVAASYVLNDSLNQIEAKYPGRFLRINRNALVLPAAMRAIVRQRDFIDGESWAVRLAGVDELLTISRRQVSAVRQALGQE